ncbi:MAG: hypothetical protein H0U58_04075 [Chloroflexi bacterium]|nr:hypothetical protein [Chloroflexota bacterium]
MVGSSPPGSNAVAGFVPSRNGLHFANRFPPGPTVKLGLVDPRWIGVGDASAGLCGGMSWLVRERFEAGLNIPPDTSAPANDSALFKTIVRRQIRSLDWLRAPVRFWWMGLRGPDWARRRTAKTEWPRIRAAIDDGRLALVGLVRHQGWNPLHLTGSHQVLAFGYTVDPAGGGITLRLYDSNWPDRDDVTATLSAAGLGQSSGELLVGMLALS